MGSREDREKLKEEYKAHYRAIRDLKKKAAESERLARISHALNQVNTDQIMESFDSALTKVKEKIELAEAKIEMALESRLNDHDNEELKEFERRREAQENLRRIKSEMGMLHEELDEKVADIVSAGKTLGPSESEDGNVVTREKSAGIKKSLGPPKK